MIGRPLVSDPRQALRRDRHLTPLTLRCSTGTDVLAASAPAVVVAATSGSFALAILLLFVLLSGPWRRGSRQAAAARLLEPVTGAWQVQDISVTRFQGSCFGAEVSGLDLHDHLLPQTVHHLREALQVHGLLLFRGQLPLRKPDLVGVAEVFGCPLPADMTEELVALYRVKDRDREPMGADFWHSDNSYMPEPGGPTVLYALQVPHNGDGIPMGDTLFADTVSAASDLPVDLRAQAESSNAAHNMSHNCGVPLPERYYKLGLPQLPDVLHPVLRKNPMTGQQAMFVSPAYVRQLQGMSPEESRPFLNALYDHMLRSSYIYRHQWCVGDLLVWDNGRLLHRATTLELPPGAERVMLRVQTSVRMPAS